MSQPIKVDLGFFLASGSSLLFVELDESLGGWRVVQTNYQFMSELNF
jgi:hypothetical protein